MSQKSEDLELFHYGVKGMKWGVSRPVGENGLVARAKSGKVAANNRQIKQHEVVRDYKSKGGVKGKALSAATLLDRMVMGEENFKKYQDLNISALKKQNARIESGKTTALDKIDIALNTPLIDVVAQRKN